MASGISRLGGDALLRKTFKKYATSLATVSNNNKNKKNTEEERLVLYIFPDIMMWMQAARYADKQAQIMHAESALIVPPRGCLNRSLVATSQPAAGHMLQRHCVVKLL